MATLQAIYLIVLINSLGVNKLEKISIVVPIYNNEEYIGECIESLVNQSYSNLEIILINDGSTDQSLNVCQSYAEKDKRIKLKSIENSGVSVARNYGLELVTGKYIMFVDSDDWIELDTVEFVYNKVKEKNVDIVIWSYFKDFSNNTIEKSLIPYDELEMNDETAKDILYLKSIYSKYGSENNYSDVSVGTVMCKMYKSDLILKNKLKFNPKLIRSEDVVFALYAFNYADKIYYVDKSLYHYRMNEGSMCSATKYIPETKEPFNLLINELVNFQNIKKDLKNYDKVLYGRTIQALLWHLKYNYYHKDNPLNLFQRRKELKELINHKHYSKALKNVDLKLLPKQERLMVNLFNRNLIFVHMFCQRIIEFKNKRLDNYYK